MCLGIPGEIVEIEGMEATVEFWDVQKSVRLDIVGDRVEPGDYILNHAGFAIRKIPDDEVEETIQIYETFLEGDEDDALEEIGAENERLGIQHPDEADAISSPGGTQNPGVAVETSETHQEVDSTPHPNEGDDDGE